MHRKGSTSGKTTAISPITGISEHSATKTALPYTQPIRPRSPSWQKPRSETKKRSPFSLGRIRSLFCHLQFHRGRNRGISRSLVHRGGDNRGMFTTVSTRCVPGFLVMITGGFVDDTILRIAQRAGEQDNVSGSRAHDFRFYGMFYH
jgi:hypothetical protein